MSDIFLTQRALREERGAHYKSRTMGKEKEKTKKAEKVEKKKGGHVREQGVYPRLAEKYKKEIIPAMVKSFNYKNVMQVPKLEKISVNVGVGQATQDQKLLETAVVEIEAITGQKAAITKAKKAISNFKL